MDLETLMAKAYDGEKDLVNKGINESFHDKGFIEHPLASPRSANDSLGNGHQRFC